MKRIYWLAEGVRVFVAVTGPEALVTGRPEACSTV